MPRRTGPTRGQDHGQENELLRLAGSRDGPARLPRIGRRRRTGFAADMTGLDVLAVAGAGRGAEEEAEARHPALAGRRLQPARDLGPEAGRRHRRPFRAIQTTVPGVQISELMPKMAQRMKHTCIIRSLNTKNGDHGGGAKLMMRGRRDEADAEVSRPRRRARPRTGPGRQPGARLRLVLLRHRRPRHGSRFVRLPRRPLRADGTVHGA